MTMIIEATVMSKTTLRGLQVLRFIAASMVLVGHIHDNLRRGRISGLESVGDPLGMPWHAGVDIFFVVSGFVMFYVSAQDFGRPGITLEFLRRRVIRVAPLYWLFTFLFVLTVFALPDKIHNSTLSPAHLTASLLFIPWLSPSGGLVPPLSVGWTLNLEILFYFLFAGALAFRKRAGLTFLIVAFCFLIVSARSGPGPLAAPMAMWGQKIILEFLFGIAIAYVFLRGVRLRTSARIAMVVLGFSSLVVGSAAGFTAFSDRWFFWGVPAAIIVAGIVLGRDLPNNLSVRLLVAGGDASYALYLSHLFTLRAVGLAWAAMNGNSEWGYLAVSIAAAIAVSVAVHRMIERPLLRLFNGAKRNSGRTRVDGVASAAIGKTGADNPSDVAVVAAGPQAGGSR